MDYGKGSKVGSGKKIRVDLRQTWRPVSTQPVSNEGAISSTASTSIGESSNPKVLNEPVGSDVISSDEKLRTLEKHSVLMEMYRTVKSTDKGTGLHERIFGPGSWPNH